VNSSLDWIWRVLQN